MDRTRTVPDVTRLTSSLTQNSSSHCHPDRGGGDLLPPLFSLYVCRGSNKRGGALPPSTCFSTGDVNLQIYIYHLLHLLFLPPPPFHPSPFPLPLPPELRSLKLVGTWSGKHSRRLSVVLTTVPRTSLSLSLSGLRFCTFSLVVASNF